VSAATEMKRREFLKGGRRADAGVCLLISLYVSGIRACCARHRFWPRNQLR